MATKIKPLLGILARGGHPLVRGLAGAWLFNEGRGNTAWDLSGSGHPGTLTGMDPASDWVAGPHGYALDFDGTDDRVIVGPDAGINLGTANACVIRCRMNLLSASRMLFGHKAWNNGGYFFTLASGLLYYCANGSYKGVSHGIIAGDEVWLGVSRQGTFVAFYKNGVPLGAVQTLAANNGLSVSSIGAYRDSAAELANMRCDYVYCWNRALSAGEMAWLYQDPFCFFRRPSTIPLLDFSEGTIHDVSGAASAASSASGTATVVPGAWQPTGTPWPEATLGIEASWRKEAMLHGMTDVAVKLGIVLTQGWFWTRRSGCSLLYELQDGKVHKPTFLLRRVAPVDARHIALSAYLPHGPGSSCCYLLRRFNSCGHQDRTVGAAVLVRMAPNGQLAPPAPNPVFGLQARQTAGAVETQHLVSVEWFYWPLDQAVVPRVFNVYWDGGTGCLDLVNPVAVVPYAGRRFYRCQSGPVEDGTYVFAVQAESVTAVESPPRKFQIRISTFETGEEPRILDVEAI